MQPIKTNLRPPQSPPTILFQDQPTIIELYAWKRYRDALYGLRGDPDLRIMQRRDCCNCRGTWFTPIDDAEMPQYYCPICRSHSLTRPV